MLYVQDRTPPTWIHEVWGQKKGTLADRLVTYIYDDEAGAIAKARDLEAKFPDSYYWVKTYRNPAVN